MLRIGLTGGIASGKSTVAELFARLGATVLDTDRIAREVVEPGQPALAALVRAFGGGILSCDGRLDRAGLRRRLFADAATRRTVEKILHPAILAELGRQAAAAPGPYQVFVVPLLVEGDRAGMVDRVLVVDCPEERQIERLMSRDGETREGAMQMLAAQVSRDQRLASADDLIVNDGPAGDLASQVALLDRKYRELAAKQ
jgi:dephospho-CoA kinase